MSAWGLEALIASALLMIAVLVGRAPFRRAFGARAAYALWALPVLRLALPPLPAWPAAATPVTLGRETLVVLIAAPPNVAEAPAWPVATILVTLWAAGAVAFLGWHLVRHVGFCRAILRHGDVIDTIDGIRVVASGAAPGPLAFGVLRRYVALPGDLCERYDPDERALALAHELSHHRRGDLLANWIALVVLALHWPNPVAWRAFRAFRADQELACDARVLAERGPAAAHAYACAILKAAHGSAVSAACHLHAIADLKGRLKMLTLSPASRRRLAAGSTVVSILVIGGLAVTASGTRATAAVTEAVTATTTLLQDDTDAPPPPGPTAPGSGGRHVATVRHGGAVHVSVTEDGRTRRYEGAAAEAWLAANPQPAVPEPPASPAPAATNAQARTIVVRPGERGTPTLMIRRINVAPGAPLPPGVVLPPDFGVPEGCGSATKAPPPAMVIKGEGGDKTYTVLCTRPDPQAVASIERNAYRQALDGLRTARRSIETQATTPDFPESERRNALAAVDTSIAEVEADLAQAR